MGSITAVEASRRVNRIFGTKRISRVDGPRVAASVEAACILDRLAHRERRLPVRRRESRQVPSSSTGTGRRKIERNTHETVEQPQDRHQLVGGFVAVACILAAVAIVGWTGVRSLGHADPDYATGLKPVEHLGVMAEGLYHVRGNAYKVLLLPTERVKTEADTKKTADAIRKELALYKAVPGRTKRRPWSRPSSGS